MASSSPSGLKATERPKSPVWRRATTRPLRTSRTSVASSIPSAASRRPSGLKASEAPGTPNSTRVRSPVRTSHTSVRHARRRRPRRRAAGRRARTRPPARTRFSPFSSSTCASVRASHSVTRAPSPVTASRRPSGLNSTPSAASRCTRSRRRTASVRASTRSTVPSRCVTASVRPSGLSARPLGDWSSRIIGGPASKRVSRRRSPARSQIRIRASGAVL